MDGVNNEDNENIYEFDGTNNENIKIQIGLKKQKIIMIIRVGLIRQTRYATFFNRNNKY